MTAAPRALGMPPGRSGEHPGASLGSNGEMVACLGMQKSGLEAVTREALGSKTRLGEGPVVQGHKKSLLF